METIVDPFYPIVPNLDWLERLLPLDVRMMQLRLRDASPAEIDRQVARGLMLCRRGGCQFVVAGHWEAAIRHGADFLHLDSGDLAEADLDAIRGAGIRLGLSAFNQADMMSVLDAEPDYIAYGPVYETHPPALSRPTQGIERITIWATSVPCPLVANGGIAFENADAVWHAGAHAIAVGADFLTHPEPEARVRQWCAWADLKRAASD